MSRSNQDAEQESGRVRKQAAPLRSAADLRRSLSTFDSSGCIMNIDITDQDLFGNLMAQHEAEDIFKSYVYERNDFQSFWDTRYKIQIISAIKGTGKSALCRLANYKIQDKWPDNICILKHDSDITPDIKSSDISIWVKEWKKNIIQIIASELGRKIGFAWKDDAMTLVETSRNEGFRQQSLLSAIFDRVKIKGMPLTSEVASRKVSEEFLSRVTDQENRIWLMLDEVDQHFDNSDAQKVKLISFFLACSELSSKIPQIHFRLTIRPNIWSILTTKSSSLAGLRQYVNELTWNNDQIRTLLAFRLIGYLKRTRQDNFLCESDSQKNNEEWLISQVFDGTFDLGAGSRPPHMALSTLSGKRPRWLIELCKSSAKKSDSLGQKTIDYESVISSMEEFGYKRMQDLSAEYKEICGQLFEIMKAFTASSPLFQRTHNLLHFITENILENVDVKISNNKTKVCAIDIANLLYSIGFMHARIEEILGEYKHIYYQNRPDLLMNEKQANVDDLFSWEIHPMFRNALFLRADGKIGGLQAKRLSKNLKRKKGNRTKRSSGRKKPRR